jgi:hypothetical protein
MSKIETNTIAPSTGTTLTLGESGDTIALGSGISSISGLSAGITEADMYRLSADVTSNTDPISSNLERVDDASFSKIGTGMSVSSGIFTFPSTGLYFVTVQMNCYSSSNDNIIIETHVTQNNSTYDSVIRTIGNGVSSGNIQTACGQTLVNVTDTTNVKIKFVATSITDGGIGGDSTQNATCFSFIRLGDSQ